MKTLNLTVINSSFTWIFAEKFSIHNLEVVQCDDKTSNATGVALNRVVEVVKQAEKDGYDAIIIHSDHWKYYGFDIESSFKGEIYQTNDNSLLHLKGDSRDTRTPFQRQSDYNFFLFKDEERVENQTWPEDIGKCNPDKVPCLFKSTITVVENLDDLFD